MIDAYELEHYFLNNFRNAIKELNVSEAPEERSEATPSLPVNALDQAMKEVQDFMKNLQTTTHEQGTVPNEKPKKSRTRRKPKKCSEGKEKRESAEASCSKSVNTTDGKPMREKSDIGNKFCSHFEKQSPKQSLNGKNEPFFHDNKKGSP